MAALSSGKQGVGVSLVCPLSSAALAASLMNAGVSKSGSPAPKPTTSTPAFFSAAALALTARVIDSETSFILSASGNMPRRYDSGEVDSSRDARVFVPIADGNELLLGGEEGVDQRRVEVTAALFFDDAFSDVVREGFLVDAPAGE